MGVTISMSVSPQSASPSPPPRSLGIVWWLGIGVLLAAGAAFAVWRFWPRVDEGIPPDPGPAAEYRGPPWFRDMTPESGLRFSNRTGVEAGQLAILEIMGGGVALLDYDGDGLLD